MENKNKQKFYLEAEEQTLFSFCYYLYKHSQKELSTFQITQLSKDIINQINQKNFNICEPIAYLSTLSYNENEDSILKNHFKGNLDKINAFLSKRKDMIFLYGNLLKLSISENPIPISLTTEKVASYLDTNSNMILTLIKNNELPAFRMGNQYRIEQRAVNAYIISHKFNGEKKTKITVKKDSTKQQLTSANHSTYTNNKIQQPVTIKETSTPQKNQPKTEFKRQSEREKTINRPEKNLQHKTFPTNNLKPDIKSNAIPVLKPMDDRAKSSIKTITTPENEKIIPKRNEKKDLQENTVNKIKEPVKNTPHTSHEEEQIEPIQVSTKEEKKNIDNPVVPDIPDVFFESPKEELSKEDNNIGSALPDIPIEPFQNNTNDKQAMEKELEEIASLILSDDKDDSKEKAEKKKEPDFILVNKETDLSSIDIAIPYDKENINFAKNTNSDIIETSNNALQTNLSDDSQSEKEKLKIKVNKVKKEEK